MNIAQTALPANAKKMAGGETFTFACHPGIQCFTECCRELELALTPYDVLRLKNGLNMHSHDFLEQYVIIEQEKGEVFPRLYLTMVDDGRASCPFVTAAGCSVYDNRPGACRAYPLGRAAYQDKAGCHEFHVLLRETHCRGFDESAAHTAGQWTDRQGLVDYNRYNDEVMAVVQHEKIKKWLRLSKQQADKFLLALYNLDDFRVFLGSTDILSRFTATEEERRHIINDDTALLQFGIRWLKNDFFGE